MNELEKETNIASSKYKQEKYHKKIDKINFSTKVKLPNKNKIV